jgi:hypothetical protein
VDDVQRKFLGCESYSQVLRKWRGEVVRADRQAGEREEQDAEGGREGGREEGREERERERGRAEAKGEARELQRGEWR